MTGGRRGRGAAQLGRSGAGAAGPPRLATRCGAAPVLSHTPPSPHNHAPGPTGKVLLLPEDPNTVVICVATGTGIAPFRYAAGLGGRAAWRWGCSALDAKAARTYGLATPLPCSTFYRRMFIENVPGYKFTGG